MVTVTKSTNFGFVGVYNGAPSAYDWACTYWNWLALDPILYAAAVTHKHDGATAVQKPTGTLGLTTAPTGGYLLSGTTYYFGVTYIDELGRETIASDIASITTPATIATPATPTNNDDATPTDVEISTPVGLSGGDYWYKIAYYKGGGETLPSSPVYVFIPSDALYQCTIHFDSLNTVANGADGIRVYRKSGNSGSYVKLLDITDADANSYTDDNTAVPTCDKAPVVASTISATNTITIDWSSLDWSEAAYVKIYSTAVADTWATNSLVTTVTMNIATPITSYEWLGTAKTAGKPPEVSGCFPSPSKINLTAGAEIQGNLPWANLPSDFTWGEPVANFAALPTGISGEVRVVEDENALYTWDAEAATPAWTLIASGEIDTYYDYEDSNLLGAGVFYFQEHLADSNEYDVCIDDTDDIPHRLLDEDNVGLYSGYYGRFDPAIEEEFVPHYGETYGADYGAVRFNWDSKKFEYWDSEIATPAWVEVT